LLIHIKLETGQNKHFNDRSTVVSMVHIRIKWANPTIWAERTRKIKHKRY